MIKSVLVSEYDCIVVGGGPAGVSTAYSMAKFNRKVLLVDRKSHDNIGNKTCGDALDMASTKILYEAFGLELPNGDEVSEYLKFLSVETKDVKVSFNAPGYTVDRHIFGQRLLKEAEDAGVTVISNATVREVIIEDNYVKGIKYLKNKEMHEVRAKLIADCSGTQAVIRNKLPDNFSLGMRKKLPDEHIAISFREIIELKEDHEYPQEISLAYLEDIPPPGYLWFFTKGPKKLNVGTGWLKSENTFDKSMKEIYKDALHKYFSPEDYTVLTHGGGQIPIRPPYDSLTFNGGLLAGEAGCMTDPTTAEGHGPALVSGYYAAVAMNEALDKGDISREGLWNYNIEIMKHYGKIHAISWVALQFLREINGPGLEFLLKRNIITNAELEAILDGDMVSVGFFTILVKAMKIFPRFGLLLKIKKLVDGAGKMVDIYEKYPANPDKLADWIRLKNDAIGVEF